MRRYAVVVTVAGQPPRAMDPAPAYDDDIPHDVVHYVVEAELGLANGVYGRAERWAGTFTSTAGRDVTARERARERRKQQRRERALAAQDARNTADMAQSERLAALCDVVWRRKHGQHADPARSAPAVPTADAADIERVVSRLDAIAPLWRTLPVGGEIVFEWPSVVPTVADPQNAGRRDAP